MCVFTTCLSLLNISKEIEVNAPNDPAHSHFNIHKVPSACRKRELIIKLLNNGGLNSSRNINHNADKRFCSYGGKWVQRIWARPYPKRTATNPKVTLQWLITLFFRFGKKTAHEEAAAVWLPCVGNALNDRQGSHQKQVHKSVTWRVFMWTGRVPSRYQTTFSLSARKLTPAVFPLYSPHEINEMATANKASSLPQSHCFSNEHLQYIKCLNRVTHIPAFCDPSSWMKQKWRTLLGFRLLIVVDWQMNDI